MQPDAITRRWDDPALDLTELLQLEAIDVDLFRANTVFIEQPGWRGEPMVSLYGGQVAAQALLAAGATVPDERRPHSLHGYFLRPGDSRVPTVFKVERDRDGRSFSARRVVAVQHGKVIFSMAASFHVPVEQPLAQVETMPDCEGPDGLADVAFPRLFSMDCRVPSSPFGDRAAWPTRFWGRAAVPLPDSPLHHAAVLTYLSDISTGILPAPDSDALPGSSLDHAVWFHAPANLSDWVLSEYQPRITGHGRGWYTGSMFDTSGTLVASIAQEALFR